MLANNSVDDQAPRYALFDIDKTITTEDTFLLLLKVALQDCPPRILLLAIGLPVFIATFVFSLEKKWAKSWVLWCLTVGKSPSEANDYLCNIVSSRSAALWIPAARDEILRLRKDFIEVVFVTASATLWTAPLLQKAQLTNCVLIGSTTRWWAGGLVLASKNCYGKEKVERLNETMPLGWQEKCACGFSDSPADIPMLQFCQQRFYISPTPRQIKKFTNAFGAQNGKILTWRG